MIRSATIAVICILLLHCSFAQKKGQRNPKPSAQQLAWHDMEFYWFIHFGPNTFTGNEWGHGDEATSVFQPSGLDCDQWVRIAKQSGAKGIIITAKHHDGFCLWPSKLSTHTIRESTWNNGQGDILKSLSEACKKGGIKFGVYISPWDRNHPAYGTDGYNDVYIGQMKEIFAAYGPIWELWWDGANGEGPNGKKQVYDFRKFEKTIRSISPKTVIFSDIGPDIRWVGNENGIAGKTNWNLLDTAGFKRGAGSPPTDTLNQGNFNGANWIPAECDVSIRPGWFFHASEDPEVKTARDLFRLYLQSVGRGSNFLLNVPPDTRGLIHENDSASLVGFRKLLNQSFSHPLGTYSAESMALKLAAPTSMNCIALQEDLKNGQMVSEFTLEIVNAKGELKMIKGTTIGHKRILCFPTDTVKKITLKIIGTKGKPVIKQFHGYKLEEELLEIEP
jgi:alpha-L-fucosidase